MWARTRRGVLAFLTAADCDITEQIRQLTKVEGDKLVFLDLPSGGAYYICETAAADAAVAKDFIADANSGKATKNAWLPSTT